MNAHQPIIRLLRKYRIKALLDASAFALVSVGVACLIVYFFIELPLIYIIVTACTVFLARLIQHNFFSFDENKLVKYLNAKYASLEQSADLLIGKDSQLTMIQRIQQQKVIAALESQNVIFKRRFFSGTLSSVFCIVILTAVSYLVRGASGGLAPALPNIGQSNRPNTETKITAMKATVVPPQYTGLEKFVTENNVRAPEGSVVTWVASFEDAPRSALFILSGRDTFKMTNRERSKEFSFSRRITGDGFYQLAWKSFAGPISYSRINKIESVPDKAPEIKVHSPALFTERKLLDTVSVTFDVDLADDYALTGADIIMTVAKGSGESVKFRELKIKFDAPIRGKTIHVSKKIELKPLGMDAGDELYFYAIVTDNKQPAANLSRTETFFVMIKDEGGASSTLEGGTPVELFPEYFRSQRQIIIDSEKLLELQKKRSISNKEFNSQSNELGSDQKLLRLRYGQFLGDEAESGLQDPNAGNESGDIREQFGHAHDSKEHIAEAPDEQVADGSEFVDRSIRVKLRTALSLMWTAELQLRLNDPKKSLPYQYKILKLLKEISNESRIYVRRTGFDPPPIKEDRRLSGELAEVKSNVVTVQNVPEKEFVGIKQAISTIDDILTSDEKNLSAKQVLIFHAASKEVAMLFTLNPAYIQTLSRLNNVTKSNRMTASDFAELRILRSELWKIIPSRVSAPAQHTGVVHFLDQQAP